MCCLYGSSPADLMVKYLVYTLGCLTMMYIMSNIYGEY